MSNYSVFILLFIFADSKYEDKIFCTEWRQALPQAVVLWERRRESGTKLERTTDLV
jgi:hypothetical protein